MLLSLVAFPLGLSLVASAIPLDRRAAFTLANGQAALALNAKFDTLTADSPCIDGENACVNGHFAQCVNKRFELFLCAEDLACVALPLVNSAGTRITCDRLADAQTRTAATSANGSVAVRSTLLERVDSPPACAAKASKRSPERRIAQDDLPDVAESWQKLCLVSGGDITTNEPCVQLAGINGINALLASGDPCDQQDNADAMIDFANSPGVTNTEALIENAKAYRIHPRNALDIGGGLIPSTPFCTRAPRNQELAGLVNGQLAGVNPGIFGGPKFTPVAFGADGTCPFGQTPNVATCTCS